MLEARAFNFELSSDLPDGGHPLRTEGLALHAVYNSESANLCGVYADQCGKQR
jgi:hypothetical protein